MNGNVIENEIDKKPYLKALNLFSYSTSCNYDYKQHITNVWVTESEDKSVTLHIKTTRPGFLIGKQGHFISEIRDYISRVTEKEIKIDVIEDDLFRNLY